MDPNSTTSSSSSPQIQAQSSSSPASLEDCLKLLRGERDEQRLAGLLLVTKICNKDDHSALRQVYDAVSPHFLHRLLRTGMGKGEIENRKLYLQLSVTVLAAFSRVPEIAASPDMLANVPLILEIIMSKESGSSVIEDCYEFIFLVSTAREDGVEVLYESGGMSVLSSQMSTLSEGSHVVELAMRLVQLMISKLPAEKVYTEHPSELSIMVAAIARQFAVVHTALKFEALHLLYAILLSEYSPPVHAALSSMVNDAWSTDMRIGIVTVLQNRVVPDDKLQALVLAECVLSIVGEGWLIGQTNLPGVRGDPIPADRCILVVLESSRVEIAVLLNELAYLRDEASKSSLSNPETVLAKQRNLGIAFSLVERIIKLISKFGEDEESGTNAIISESTFTKIIKQLNETIDTVLEYLQDVKEHGQKKGDDLLASVRLVGSYLAETPHACKEKVRELLSYMLSVEGLDEPSPFYSVCFLLPMLCQVTMRTDGCRILASTGAYKAVIEYLISMITTSDRKAEDSGSIFLACDTILNFLTKREQLQFSLNDPSFVKLLGALLRWTEDVDDPSITMMASSMCALILDSTSEGALVRHPDFDNCSLTSMALLIKKSLAICGQDMMSEDAKDEADLHQIITSAYSRWVGRFPHVRAAIEG